MKTPNIADIWELLRKLQGNTSISHEEKLTKILTLFEELSPEIVKSQVAKIKKIAEESREGMELLVDVKGRIPCDLKSSSREKNSSILRKLALDFQDIIENNAHLITEEIPELTEEQIDNLDLDVLNNLPASQFDEILLEIISFVSSLTFIDELYRNKNFLLGSIDMEMSRGKEKFVDFSEILTAVAITLQKLDPDYNADPRVENVASNFQHYALAVNLICVKATMENWNPDRLQDALFNTAYALFITHPIVEFLNSTTFGTPFLVCLRNSLLFQRYYLSSDMLDSPNYVEIYPRAFAARENFTELMDTFVQKFVTTIDSIYKE